MEDADDEESISGNVEESTQLDGIDKTGSADPITGDLAMAMRISPVNSDSAQTQEQSGTVQEMLAQSMAASHGQAQAAATSEQPQRRESDVTPPTGSIPVTQPGSSSETGKAGQTEESKSTHSSDFEAELNKFRGEPVRGAHVQIAGAENQRLDIRLQERDGTLSLTLRSNDSTLTRALQEHAPELNTRLSAEHFRTELWTPDLDRKSQERSGSGNGGQRQERGEANDGDQRQGRNQQQNHEPEWIAEFENRPATFQKRIDYTWHQ